VPSVPIQGRVEAAYLNRQPTGLEETVSGIIWPEKSPKTARVREEQMANAAGVQL
jgi:hypothetical protein